MLKPQGFPRIIWDLSTTIVLLYLVVSLPLRMGFELDPLPNSAEHWFERSLDIFFCVDILVNFRTGFVDENGRLQMGGMVVARNYFKSWFLLDLVSSIPYDEFTAGLGGMQAIKSAKFSKVLKVTKLLKLSKLMKSSAFAEAMEDWVSTNRFLLQLGRMFFVSFALSHFIACFWAFSGQFGACPADVEYCEPQEERRWWNHYVHVNWGIDSIMSKYLTSFYWAITTITTVGYGDITPTSDFERGYCILAMLVGGAFYGYIIATINNIVTNMDANSRVYNETMDGICSYLNERKFPALLAFKVRRYFKNYLVYKTALDETGILEKLSPQLRQLVAQFLIDHQYSVVRQCSFFKGVNDTAFTRLLSVLKPLRFERETIICSIGEKSKDAYIVKSGELHMLDKSGAILGALKQSDIFGELSVLDIEPVRGCSLVAADDSECYSIAREDLVNGFGDMPDAIDVLSMNAINKGLRTYKDPHRIKVLKAKLTEVETRIEMAELWQGNANFRSALGVDPAKATVEEMREVFNSLDADKGGTLSKEEMAAAMRRAEKSPEEIEEELAQLPSDDISFEIFLKMMAPHLWVAMQSEEKQTSETSEDGNGAKVPTIEYSSATASEVILSVQDKEDKNASETRTASLDVQHVERERRLSEKVTSRVDVSDEIASMQAKIRGLESDVVEIKAAVMGKGGMIEQMTTISTQLAQMSQMHAAGLRWISRAQTEQMQTLITRLPNAAETAAQKMTDSQSDIAMPEPTVAERTAAINKASLSSSPSVFQIALKDSAAEPTPAMAPSVIQLVAEADSRTSQQK
jgi:CRP-like cAMP-binding protein